MTVYRTLTRDELLARVEVTIAPAASALEEIVRRYQDGDTDQQEELDEANHRADQAEDDARHYEGLCDTLQGQIDAAAEEHEAVLQVLLVLAYGTPDDPLAEFGPVTA